MIINLLLGFAFLAVPLRLLAHGDLHEQIDAVSREIQAAPESGPLYLRRAELHRAHGDWAPAKKDYARAEEFQADAALIHLGRGKLFLATGDARNACIELDPVIEKTPGHLDALATRARARAKSDDCSGAVADYSAVIAATARPEPDHYAERAAVLASAKPPRSTEALRGLEEGIARLGSPVTLVLAALDLEVKSGQFDDALKRINRAATNAKRPEQWYVRRAEVLELAGRHSEARTAWAQTLAAIEALPPRHRQVAATTALETRIRQGLSVTKSDSSIPVTAASPSLAPNP